MLEDLPGELLLKIFDYLDVDTLTSLYEVNNRCNKQARISYLNRFKMLDNLPKYVLEYIFRYCDLSSLEILKTVDKRCCIHARVAYNHKLKKAIENFKVRNSGFEDSVKQWAINV